MLHKDESSELKISDLVFSPWHFTCADKTVCCRYVIGRSKYGFHWDLEFVISDGENGFKKAKEKLESNSAAEDLCWSPACASFDLAVRQAHRDAQIRSAQIDLDTSTKVCVTEQGSKLYRKISDVKIHKRLSNHVNRFDLQRLATYHNYLNWREFQTGILDLNARPSYI